MNRRIVLAARPTAFRSLATFVWRRNLFQFREKEKFSFARSTCHSTRICVAG